MMGIYIYSKVPCFKTSKLFQSIIFGRGFPNSSKFHQIQIDQLTSNVAHVVSPNAGLTTDEAMKCMERSGCNAIHVRVPGRLESLVMEFSNFYYVPWHELKKRLDLKLKNHLVLDRNLIAVD